MGSFFATAANPQLEENNKLCFRYHVLEETSFPVPGYPPYYSSELFATIIGLFLLMEYLNCLNTTIPKDINFITSFSLFQPFSCEVFVQI